jgi:hypothetical protein
MRNHVAVPVMAIVALAGLAECLTYFAVAPAPVSQSAALAAPLATQAPPLVWETATLTLVDRGRPSNEDIVKAFRLATEDREPVVAQVAIFDTAIPRPVPLPKRRPPPRPEECPMAASAETES